MLCESERGGMIGVFFKYFACFSTVFQHFDELVQGLPQLQSQGCWDTESLFTSSSNSIQFNSV